MTYGLWLAFAAAFAWGALDASRKALVQRVPLVPLLVGLTLLQIPLFGGWTALAGGTIRSVDYVWPLLATVGLNVAANVLYLRAISLSPLSLMIPLLSFAPVFTALVANPLLGEVPTPVQLAGVGLVVIGALLLNADRREGGGPWALARALVKERGSLPMLGTSFCWSLTIIFDKLALEHADSSVHGIALNGAVGVIMIGVLVVRRELSQLRELGRAPGLLALAVVVASGALALQLLAIQFVYVAIVEAIKRAISLAASVLLGRIVFAEPVTAFKLSAITLMALGTAAVVLA